MSGSQSVALLGVICARAWSGAIESDGKAAYSVGLELVQMVKLARLPEERIFAVTWSTGRVGLAAPDDLRPDVLQDLRALVERFLQALAGSRPG